MRKLVVGLVLLLIIIFVVLINAYNKIQKNDEKVNERIDKLEEKTGNDIQNIRQEINDIKGDFATTFVLREDFFRSMNGVEDRMKIIDNKLDKLLLMGKENK